MKRLCKLGVFCAEMRYCDKCKALKPDRAHHCSVCGRSAPLNALSLSVSLSQGVRRQVTTPIRSRKLQRHQGSVDTLWSGHVSLRAWSCAGHWKTRCSATSSAPLQWGQVAESRRPVRCRYAASNGEWPLASAQLSHRYALVPCPVTLPVLMNALAVGEDCELASEGRCGTWRQRCRSNAM